MLKLYSNSSRGFEFIQDTNSSEFRAYINSQEEFAVQAWKTLNPIWSLDGSQDVRKSYFDEKNQMIGYDNKAGANRSEYLMLIHIEIPEYNAGDVDIAFWGAKVIRQTITREKNSIIINIFAKLILPNGYIGVYSKKDNFVKSYFWDKYVTCEYKGFRKQLKKHTNVDVNLLDKLYRQKNEDMRQALRNSYNARVNIKPKLIKLGLNISYYEYYFEYADRRYYYSNNSIKELKILINQTDFLMSSCGF